MAHIDSRRNRRLAKALDLANLSVKGRHGPSQPGEKKKAAKHHRAAKKRDLVALRNFICSGVDECPCPGCSDEALGFSDQQIRRQHPYYACMGMHDILGPALAAGRHMVQQCESFDEWYSWLKNFFPDTVAGRHAMNHIMNELDSWIECVCRAGYRNATGNFRPCTCGLAFGRPEWTFGSLEEDEDVAP